MKLIDADKLSKDGYFLERNYQKDSTTNVIEIRKIEDIPIVDAVPVIRCKDCKWYELPSHKITKNCVRWMKSNGILLSIEPNDYCSYGEIREDEKKLSYT